MRHLLLVLLASFAIAAPVAAIDDLTPSVAPVPMLLAASEAALPPDPVLCAPGGNWAGTDLCPESPPTPVNPIDEMEMTGAIIILGGAVLLVIFQALRPLLPSRPAPSRRAPSQRAVRRRQEWGRRLRFLLALSPILLVAALIVSMGLQLWELTGVVVALMAVFGVLAVLGIRYALGVHIATEIIQHPNDPERFYLINRFVPAIGPFAGKVDVVQPPRKRRRTTKVGAKAKAGTKAKPKAVPKAKPKAKR